MIISYCIKEKWNTRAYKDDLEEVSMSHPHLSAAMTLLIQRQPGTADRRVDHEGGLADVHGGCQTLVGIDCWNPISIYQQVLYYKNGLSIICTS